MNEEKFKELYAKLNKSQKEAVDSIDGPVVVMAGPGTGKTQILALRIANILRLTDTRPEQILAITFTDAGVAAMRERLVSIIGVEAYRVPIFTFHGFCNEIIFRFSEYFPELIGSRPAGDLDKITLMQQVFDSVALKELASFRSPYHYVRSVIGAISLLKREAMTPSVLRKKLDDEETAIKSSADYRHEKGPHKGKIRGIYLEREESIKKNRELALLYEKYEEALAKEKLYDFDDMIIYVAKSLENDENLRLILQEEYQYILADEHQDANGGQNKVLHLLSSFHESPNLFIVGDEKQAIYRFQGASVENFLYFKKAFPGVKVISLSDNYRSSQTILDVAEGILPCDIKLLAKSNHKEVPITVKEFKDSLDEARSVALGIKKRISSGVSPEEIAVFTRTNSELGIYAEALSLAGVPFALQSKGDALDDGHIEKLLTILRALISTGDDISLLRALHLDCFDISELDIFILAREVSRQKVSLFEFVSSREKLSKLNLENRDELIRVLGEIVKWKKLGHNVSLAELVSTVARESGVIGKMIESGDLVLDKFKKLSTFISYLEDYQSIHKHARLEDLAPILDLLDEYNVLEVKTSSPQKNKVKLSTAHRAKGLEYDYVYLVGVEEGSWSGGRSHRDFKLPGLVAVTKEDEEDDDRRLFYVALTRARKELEISYAVEGDNGQALLPSRFVSELPRSFVNILKQAPQSLSATSIADSCCKFGGDRRELDLKNFVRETLEDGGLAVTGLNNYLKCPWRYFYRSLLRVPEPQTTPLMYGNAVHRTLKHFFDVWASGQELAKDDLIKRFKLEINKEPMTDKESVGAVDSGVAALEGYFDNYYPNWERNIKNEFPIDAIFPVGDLNLRLTGKLDKVEFLKDGSARVVDYKTGKVKTRNFIEGKTKEEGSGDYKRQLTFYKLLLGGTEGGLLNSRRPPSSCFDMRSGVIDFIEPDSGGKYHREEFEVGDKEVLELGELIKISVEEILSLSFWNKTCENKDCEYCKLRQMVK